MILISPFCPTSTANLVWFNQCFLSPDGTRHRVMSVKSRSFFQESEGLVFYSNYVETQTDQEREQRTRDFIAIFFVSNNSWPLSEQPRERAMSCKTTVDLCETHCFAALEILFSPTPDYKYQQLFDEAVKTNQNPDKKRKMGTFFYCRVRSIEFRKHNHDLHLLSATLNKSWWTPSLILQITDSP